MVFFMVDYPYIFECNPHEGSENQKNSKRKFIIHTVIEILNIQKSQLFFSKRNISTENSFKSACSLITSTMDWFKKISIKQVGHFSKK